MMESEGSGGSFGAAPASTSSPAGHAAATGSLPTVTGPITGGTHGAPYSTFIGDLSAIDMIEEEYFLTGEATRFQPIGTLEQDGKWKVQPAGTATYRTRMLVYRPRDPAKFNGTIIILGTVAKTRRRAC